MILTNEDLLAISQVVDARLDIRLQPMERDIKDLKADVADLKQNVSILEKNVNTLTDRVDTLTDRVDTLTDRVDTLTDRVDTLTDRVVVLEDHVIVLEENVQRIDTRLRNVELFQENKLLPRLNTIESCYLDTYSRYQRNNDKMEAAFGDIDLLKKVAMDHSEKLQKLA